MQLIKTDAVRRTFLDRVQRIRPGTVWRPTQVSQEAVAAVNAAALAKIDNILRTHPTVGKTVRP